MTHWFCNDGAHPETRWTNLTHSTITTFLNWNWSWSHQWPKQIKNKLFHSKCIISKQKYTQAVQKSVIKISNSGTIADWFKMEREKEAAEVFSSHLVVLFSIQDRIPSLWKGWTRRRRVGEAAQHVIYVPVSLSKTRFFLVCPKSSLCLKAADPTWWTPGRSGRPPWLPCVGRVAWRTCRAGHRWHRPRAPCRSGSGWRRTTSCDNDNERNEKRWVLCVSRCPHQVTGGVLEIDHHKKTEAENLAFKHDMIPVK